MARESKIETSPHFNEIVDLLLTGHSGRHVSDYLKNEYNEKISHTTLSKYKKDNLDVKAHVKKNILKREKAKQEAIKKQTDTEIKLNESFEAAVNYIDKDIKKLDNLICDAEKVVIDIEDYNVTSAGDKYDPAKKIELQLKYKKLALDAIKTKHDILSDDSTTIDINLGMESAADAITRSLQEIKKE